MSAPDPYLRQQAAHDLESHISQRLTNPKPIQVVCAIIDFQVGWSKEVFWKFSIPTIGFFTFGACAAAMEYGAWKAEVGNMKPGEIRAIPGLPEQMSLSYSCLRRRTPGPSRGGPGPARPGGPPKPGDRPPWVAAIEGTVALMFNTCDDLDRPFLDYMANQMGKPVWGVGPLLPQHYWNSGDSLVSDRLTRSLTRQSSCTEDEVIQWLNKKPRGSVLYVSFGSEVCPTTEEYTELASALEDSTRPFIWVIQSGSIGGDGYLPPDGMNKRVEGRGLIICGWAPQLLILSHQSTGGFLSHCGWNSTTEAIGLGVPFLAWPIRGDQYFNAKLVVCHLKVGYMISNGEFSDCIKKEDIVNGIEKLMGDDEIKKRAAAIRSKFQGRFPMSSEAALDDFVNYFKRQSG